MKLILPKTYVEPDANTPLFFVAGPIMGGGNWQVACCKLFAEQIQDFYAVVPCRWREDDELFSHRVPGRDNLFDRQTEWERHYLRIAAIGSRYRSACILFWLPIEDKQHPRSDGNPYARDTYGELGRWARDAALTGGRIIVGAEADFPGLSVIEANLRLDVGKSFPIYSTLQETVEQAVRWVKV